MQNETLQDLTGQIQALSNQVFSVLENDQLDPALLKMLREKAPAADPELNRTLTELFQRQPKGKKEFLRMEIDVLRRASRGQETESIFRAYGVLNLVTPVKHLGKTTYAIISGPIKINPWTPQEKETLATLCGISLRDLPASLDQTEIYSPEQVKQLIRQQNREAALWTLLLNQEPSTAKEEKSLIPSNAGMDLLQPGFADHLDLLFSSIQRELRHSETQNAPHIQRMQTATNRGRHLVNQIRTLSQSALSGSENVSVHAILGKWETHFRQQLPSLRINLRLEAEDDKVTANLQQLQHMLFTLMASVADGLPEGRAVMGLSTRNSERNGESILHLEIRDGGGLATFAGVGGESDRQMLLEQNEAAGEFADWFTLASHMDAELHLLRDDGVVTRAELFLPLHPQMVSEDRQNVHQIWIVEDDDREYESLQHMLSPAGLQLSRFSTAADLRQNFALAKASPDMVLLKYYLPDQRGAEVRSWLYEQDSNLPVILISSLQATHPGIATANSLPSTLYLQKPFDSQSLLDMVKMNLDDTLAG